MKKIISILGLFVVLLSFNPLYAQWAKTYGKKGDDRAFSIRQTSDGGYIVAGYTTSFGVKDQDCWVLNLDESGHIRWQQSFGDDGDDQAHSVLQTSDGDFVVAGWIYFGGMGFSPDDIWIYKLDPHGNVKWQEFQGDILPDYHSTERGYSVYQTSDGGYIVAGQRKVNYEEDPKSFRFNVLKLDSEGQAEWQKFYGSQVKDDLARSIQQTEDDGFIVAGSTESYGAGERDFWLLKLDEEGEIEWQKAYGGKEDEYAESIQQTSDGGYIVAGVTNSFGAGEDDFWVLKLDPSGIIEWEYTYGGMKGDYAHEIHHTKNGEYIVAGGTWSFGEGKMDVWVLKLDSEGVVKWGRTYGGQEYDSGFSVQQTHEGGYVVAGATESFGEGNKDVFVLKFDPNGNISDYCNRYMNKIKGQVMPTQALVTMTNSGVSSVMFEYGETFIVTKKTNGVLNKVCRTEDLITLKISTTNGGTTDPVPGTYTYPLHSDVEVRAIPEEHFEFDRWTGDVSLEQKNMNPVVIRMNTSKAITAHFGRKHILTISSSDCGTTDPSPGTHSYAAGTEVTIHAHPSSHCQFIEWSGNIPAGKRYDNPITLTMNRDRTIRSNFAKFIQAPLNFSGQKVENRSYSQIEYINILRWRRNPNNRYITSYRIYVVEGASQSLIAEVNAQTFEYWHRNTVGDREYTYALVAVDNENTEGEPALIVVR